MENMGNNGTEKIGLVTLTPGLKDYPSAGEVTLKEIG